MGSAPTRMIRRGRPGWMTYSGLVSMVSQQLGEMYVSPASLERTEHKGSTRHRRAVTGCRRFAALARRHAITGVQTPSCNTVWVTQGSRLRERRPFPGSLAAQVASSSADVADRLRALRDQPWRSCGRGRRGDSASPKQTSIAASQNRAPRSSWPVEISVARRRKKQAIHAHQPRKVTTMTEPPPPLRAFGDTARLTAGLVHIIEDLPGALDRLTSAAGTARFDPSSLSCARRDSPYSTSALWDDTRVELRYLRTVDGAEVDEDVVTDPAQWAVLIEEDSAVVDVVTGDVVDESAVDWSTEDDAEAAPEEGKRHANTVKDGTVYLPAYYCLDYLAAGFTLDAWFRRNAGITEAVDGSTAGDAVDLDGDAADLDGDSEEAEAARAAARAQAEAETVRRERRKVLALNRLGDSATHVRRDFMTKLLARPTPKGRRSSSQVASSASPH
jgi:hypothetical protein